jgi:hypothetical protein
VIGDEKQQFLKTYKESMATKPCKYYEEEGSCPFGAHCFYNHNIEVKGELKVNRNKGAVSSFEDDDFYGPNDLMLFDLLIGMGIISFEDNSDYEVDDIGERSMAEARHQSSRRRRNRSARER